MGQMPNHDRTSRRAVLAGIASAIALPLVASGQQFPVRPLKLMVGFAAGGATDIAMRALAEHAGDYLGQPVLVEVRTGAGGTVPAQLLQTAAADGYTIAHIGIGIYRLPYTVKLTWDPYTDISHIIRLAGYVLGPFTAIAGPIQNLGGPGASSKERPGTPGIWQSWCPHRVSRLDGPDCGTPGPAPQSCALQRRLRSAAGNPVRPGACRDRCDRCAASPRPASFGRWVYGLSGGFPRCLKCRRSRNSACRSWRLLHSGLARHEAPQRLWSADCTTRSSTPWISLQCETCSIARTCWCNTWVRRPSWKMSARATRMSGKRS